MTLLPVAAIALAEWPRHLKRGLVKEVALAAILLLLGCVMAFLSMSMPDISRPSEWLAALTRGLLAALQ